MLLPADDNRDYQQYKSFEMQAISNEIRSTIEQQFQRVNFHMIQTLPLRRMLTYTHDRITMNHMRISIIEIECSLRQLRDVLFWELPPLRQGVALPGSAWRVGT
jgi:hypothetical protein